MSRIRLFDRKTTCLLPPTVKGWLPEGRLARFVEAMERLDLSDKHIAALPANWEPCLAWNLIRIAVLRQKSARASEGHLNPFESSKKEAISD